MLIYHDDIEQCIKVLASGGLILYPTDTIWGIGCDATNSNAVQKIYSIKKRPDEKSMIILVANEKEIEQYVQSPDPRLFDHLNKTEKPVTVIYENAHGLASGLIANDNTIAIRICKESFCKDLIKQFGKPIVSTSANISGQPSPKTFGEITGEIKRGVDYIVQYRREDKNISQPSAIIRWKDGVAEIIRP